MHRECRERFPCHRIQRKPLVSVPAMHHGTCVTHVPWCMSGPLTRGVGENVPGIPGVCATLNFTYMVRNPWKERVLAALHRCNTSPKRKVIWFQLSVCLNVKNNNCNELISFFLLYNIVIEMPLAYHRVSHKQKIRLPSLTVYDTIVRPVVMPNCIHIFI